MWTMENVQAHFRSPSGLKIYMMILPSAKSDEIIIRIMRQSFLFSAVYCLVLAVVAPDEARETPFTLLQKSFIH